MKPKAKRERLKQRLEALQVQSPPEQSEELTPRQKAKVGVKVKRNWEQQYYI